MATQNVSEEQLQSQFTYIDAVARLLGDKRPKAGDIAKVIYKCFIVDLTCRGAENLFVARADFSEKVLIGCYLRENNKTELCPQLCVILLAYVA